MKRWLFFITVLTFTAFSPVSAQDISSKILEESPRHHQWVAVKQGEREVHSFLVFPEVKGKALSVVIIHENRGLTDWVRSVADRVAEAGYIAIAPDLLSGMGPGGGRTKDFPDSDAAREALYGVPQEQITADLNAVADYVTGLEAANGKLAVTGFCWGGRQSFQFASDRSDLAASFVFYGTGPDTIEAVNTIKAPVYGFYGGDDARVNATIAGTAGLMRKAGKTFEPVTYEGAGHAFMRRGEEAEPSEANRKAKEEGWARWLELMKGL
ncbi:MAG: dienelactone hydrolase family protein [bacterium]|nr:MAG: dienelactone hydrolase family protein [bacterium]